MEDKTLDLLREGKLKINFNGEKIPDPSSKATTKEDNTKSKKKEHQKDSKAKDKSAHREKPSGKNDKSARKADTKKAAPQPNAEEEDESDGGFFE